MPHCPDGSRARFADRNNEHHLFVSCTTSSPVVHTAYRGSCIDVRFHPRVPTYSLIVAQKNEQKNTLSGVSLYSIWDVLLYVFN